ncbi:DUF3649 domain-containing protein [Oxalobacter sp. OttesenSCG-928-P03]|nr:DUF3649 domain-containing protein [Oxalobacter sp. OttesenSCG-928-P03]
MFTVRSAKRACLSISMPAVITA